MSPSTIDQGASPSKTRPRSLSPHNSLTDKHSTSLPWILHHILEEQLSHELPLRIMFSFNAGQQLPTLRQAQQWWQYEPQGKLIIDFISSLPQRNLSTEKLAVNGTQSEQDLIESSDLGQVGDYVTDLCEVDRFMSFNHDLLFGTSSEDHQSADRRQTRGLPPNFVRNLCLKVFSNEYKDVDFGQALTSLDYLRDLELSRRTALREAAERLNIREDSWKSVLQEEPEAYAWVSSVQLQELEIENYYAAIFVDLRIWTMVHELQSEPFYKPNVLAMFNTLFPPSPKDMPNARIDVAALEKYRTTFYGHILAVEVQGSAIVKGFIDKLQSPDTKHSWPETRKNLVAYIELADKMITQANDIRSVEFFRRDSYRLSKNVSDTQSPFSERPATASSATTSFDDSMSPILNPKASDIDLKSSDLVPNDSSHKTTNNSPEVGTVFEQSALAPPSSTVQPPLEGSRYSVLRDRTPKLSLKTQPKASRKSTFSSRFLTLSRSKPSPLTLPPDALHYTHNPPTVSSPLADPQNEVNASDLQERKIQPVTTNDLPISSAHNLPSHITFDIKSDLNPPAATHSKKPAAAGGLEFLNHPYEPPPHPKLKSKASLGSIFLRQKSSFGPSKLDIAMDSPRSSHEEMKSETPNKLSKKQSFNSLEKTITKTSTVSTPSTTYTTTTTSTAESSTVPAQKHLKGWKGFAEALANKPARHREVSHVRKDTISGPIFVKDENNPYELYKLVPTPQLPGTEDDNEGSLDKKGSANKKADVKSRQILSPDFFRPTNFDEAQPESPTSAAAQMLGESEEDYLANERAREWLIADSRARVTGVSGPSRSPLIPFEQPRATPRLPTRSRQLSMASEASAPGVDGTNSGEKVKEKQKHVEPDVSRFSM